MAEWVRHKTSTVSSLTATISASQCGRVESPSFFTDFYTGTAKIPWLLLCWRRGFPIGGRTAWSCHVIVHGTTFAARYWFDGDFVQNAMEDAAEVALKVLDSKSCQQPSQGPPSGAVPWALDAGSLRFSSSFLSTPPFEGLYSQLFPVLISNLTTWHCMRRAPDWCRPRRYVQHYRLSTLLLVYFSLRNELLQAGEIHTRYTFGRNRTRPFSFFNLLRNCRHLKILYSTKWRAWSVTKFYISFILISFRRKAGVTDERYNLQHNMLTTFYDACT